MDAYLAAFARIVIALAILGVSAAVSWTILVSPLLDVFHSISRTLGAAIGA